MVILIDTREQENRHITSYFDKQKISYIGRKLNFGDYSFMLLACPALRINRDIYFDGDIAIERKGSLEELSGNLTQDRARFESELIRANKEKLLLMVENADDSFIVGHKYKTQYDPKAFIATLKTYEARYNLGINFVPGVCAGNFIYHTLYYYLREWLKDGVAIE
jgi:hypothetical protein